MAVGGTLAGDSFDSCIDIKSSDTVLEDLQVAVGSPELSHMADSHKMDVDSALPAALLTDVCMFVARSFFITLSSSSSSKVKVVSAGHHQTTPGQDHANRGCCSCGSFTSSSTSTLLGALNPRKPNLTVSHGDVKLDAMNRPKLTCSTNNSNGSSFCHCSSSCGGGCSKNCCSIGTSRGACERYRVRWSCRRGRVLSAGSGCIRVWSFLEVACCVLVVSLVMGVCSAACLGEVNCSSTQLNAGSQTQMDHNAASGDSSLSAGRTDSGSYKRNHPHEALVSTQNFVLQNTVLTSQVLANSDVPRHFARDVAQVAFLSATKPAATTQDSDEDLSKIIGVVIPFVCVIIIAIILCVMWKLCRKYKCCNNEACLQKCSAICDSCMSAPYTFQVPAHVKIQSQMSRDSTGLTLISHNRPGSLQQVQRNAGNIVRQPHSKLNTASHGASATSLSRHSSSRSSRHIATNTQGARQITHSAKQTPGQGQDPAQPQKVAYASVHQNET